MYEWEVQLINGTAWIYAERYTLADGNYQFWSGQSILKSIPADQVRSIKRTWPESDA
jgi:hypothetical protein